jgi:hypothetical protein
MPGNHLYEYSVIRYVPRVERGELMNIGVILYCKELEFLGMLYDLNAERILSFYPHTDVGNLAMHLRSFVMVAKGEENVFGIASMEQSFRFRWIASRRSTIIQTSSIHPGYCDDPEMMLRHLFEELVLVK